MEHVDHDLTLIRNSNADSFYEELLNNLDQCNRFFFSVAFINYSGLQLLIDVFKNLDRKNITGKIITSTYQNFTDIKSLRKLQQFYNIDTKIYIANEHKGFHTKGYIFEYDDYYKIIVGSSNITQSALKINVEWNVRYISKSKSDSFANTVLEEFNKLWEVTSEINDSFLEQYEDFLTEISQFVRQEREIFEHRVEIKENKMQIEALRNLDNMRSNNQNKALIVAATGTGKTYLSAFDVKNTSAKKVLFLVHREVILNDAMKSFQRVLPQQTMTKFQGQHQDMTADYVFAMIPTLYHNDNYKKFARDHFDYIIADEAHRAYSESYKTILKYFTPNFLLGMTATPERTDHGNIFEMFNNNIALEVRLREALEEDLVVPFHYFGIQDVTTDLKDIDITKIEDVAKRLSLKDRVDLVIEKMEHYEHDGNKRKCLGFCASKEHAEYMANEFNSFDYPSTYLTGESSDQDRQEAIERLEDNKDPLEFIFTVDIFNEGIDIPSVNLVLMLRPTQSPIVFTQQLGRGLRKHEDKDFLTVLDFIGNHNRTFLIPIALSGSRYYDKDSLKVQLHNNFSDIPGCTNIQLDEITKQQIFEQLEKTNFNYMKYLKDEYFEFKKVLGGFVPSIKDFVLHESAPDPTKFISKKNSYIEFSHYVDEDCSFTLNNKELKIQRTLDKQLPIKRINEFVILKYLFQHETIDYETAKKEICKFVADVDEASLSHSFKYYSGEIIGEKEKDPFFFIKGNGKNKLKLTDTSLKHTESMLQTLDYGILRFQEEFGKDKMEYPYLKLYYQYKMKDMGFLTNYEKTFSAIRGTGVWRNGNHYYLFVDLHKGEEVEEDKKYRDKLLSRHQMQWQTQNKTSQSSQTGMDICYNKERNKHLHMFIRKAKKIGNQTLDYIYVGEVNSLSHEGNKPITIQMEFVIPLPKYLYDDLTLEV